MRRLAAILVLSALFVAASAVAAPSAENQARLESTVRYLQEVQNADGGFGGAPGTASNQMISAWVALALAAAGINPQDQKKTGGLDVYSYLVGHYRQELGKSDCRPVACTTTLDRELMAVNASGADPHDFGGVDLAKDLVERAGEDGAFPHNPGGQPGVNDTIFAIFALAPIREPAAQAAIQPAADWVEDQQRGSGGWHWATGVDADEVDMTGAAIQALIAAGRGRNAAVEAAADYLRKAQNPDGGFPEFPGNPKSNAASTAWAVQAIWAMGENPEEWLTESGGKTEEPLDFMESLQAADGSIRWNEDEDAYGVWMTAYVAPAFAGQAWPIPAPPRAKPPTAPPQPGAGGGSQSGAGVIAGGGGRRAPLFSRPKPQSRGKTPGGARVVENRSVRSGRGAQPRNHSATRRGENTEQPQATQRVEARSEREDETASDAAAGPGSGSSLDERGSSVAGAGPGASQRAGGDGGGGSADWSQLPPDLAASGSASSTGAGGEEVTGAVIGAGDARSPGLHFGAPGLHGAGVDDDEEWAAAIGIGALAMLLALAAAGWERRRQEAIL